MTDDRLREIRERREKATPAPWQTRFVYRMFRAARNCDGLIQNTPSEQDWSDADMVAHAPADIDYLLTEVARLDTALTECSTEAAEDLAEYREHYEMHRRVVDHGAAWQVRAQKAEAEVARLTSTVEAMRKNMGMVQAETDQNLRDLGPNGSQ